MTATSEQRRGWTPLHILGAAALALLLGGSGVLTYIGFHHGFGWVGLIGVTAASMAFPQLIAHAMVRPIDYRRAMRRHNLRMHVSTVAYIATLFAALWAYHAGLTAGPLGYLIAIAPAVPALVMVGSMFLILKEEDDEFIRARIIEASMWATGLTMGEAMVWGFLEGFGKVPHLLMWVVPIVFIFQFGLASAILARRYR